jgi:hypothetical protein
MSHEFFNLGTSQLGGWRKPNQTALSRCWTSVAMLRSNRSLPSSTFPLITPVARAEPFYNLTGSSRSSSTASGLRPTLFAAG